MKQLVLLFFVTLFALISRLAMATSFPPVLPVPALFSFPSTTAGGPFVVKCKVLSGSGTLAIASKYKRVTATVEHSDGSMVMEPNDPATLYTGKLLPSPLTKGIQWVSYPVQKGDTGQIKFDTDAMAYIGIVGSSDLKVSCS